MSKALEEIVEACKKTQKELLDGSTQARLLIINITLMQLVKQVERLADATESGINVTVRENRPNTGMR